MLGWAKNTLRKSEAAVVIQELFEGQLGIRRSDDLGRIANSLVAAVWDHRPAYFEGRIGPRPHKLSVAAIALAYGMEEYKRQPDVRMMMFAALGSVLLATSGNARTYGFTVTDAELLGVADKAFTAAADELTPEPAE